MANILVVQDVEQIIDDMKLSLGAGAHQLLIARSVDNAITLLNATSFDMVISSVCLSNSSAFDLLKFVKGDAERRSIPFVFFCCNPSELAKSVSETMRSTAMLLGADKFIMQDVFQAEEFRAEIESLLPVIRQPV
jgi:CheY-like chemotaxis protein